MTLQEPEVNTVDVGDVADSAPTNMSVKVSFQRYEGSEQAVRLKLQLWHDNPARSGNLPSEVVSSFAAEGGVYVECEEGDNAYTFTIRPVLREYCGMNDDERGVARTAIKRALSEDKGSHHIHAMLNNVFLNEYPTSPFPMTPIGAEIDYTHGSAWIVAVLDKGQLAEMASQTRELHREPVARRLGRFDANTDVKQEYREQVWPLLLPPGTYIPGLKVLTLSGCYPNEVRLLHESMGITPRDMVLVDDRVTGPVAIQNATGYRGMMLRGCRLSDIMGTASNGTTLQPGSVVAANADFCGPINRLQIAQLRLFVNSGALYNHCRIAVTYLRGRETVHLAAMRELGLGRDDTLRVVMEGIASEAGYQLRQIAAGEYVNECMPYGWSVFELRRPWGYNGDVQPPEEAMEEEVRRRVRERLLSLVPEESDE